MSKSSTTSKTESLRSLDDPAMDPVIESVGNNKKPFEPISPTAITHAIRRPKSARYPTPDGRMGFLAAEQFSSAGAKFDKSRRHIRSASPASRRRRGRDSMGSFPEFVNLSSLNCSSSSFPNPKFVTDQNQDTTMARFDAEASAFSTPPRSRQTTKSSKEEGGTPERSATIKQQQRVSFSGVDEIRTGCINPVVERTKSAIPSEQQIGLFMDKTKEKRGQFAECAFMACDYYRGTCGADSGQQQRADDEEFFVNMSSGNPQAPHSPGSPSHRSAETPSTYADQSYLVGQSRDRGSSTDRRAVKTVLSAESTTADDEFSVSFLRSRSMRYPDAAKIGPSDDNSILEAPPTLDENSVFTGAESILDLPAEDDSPKGMRNYRLALFEADMQAQLVPKSQLSRALTELDHRDDDVDELSVELNRTKNRLSKTKEELKRNEKMEQKFQTSLTDMKAKYITEKQALHDRLQRESEENNKLQTRLSSLSLEVSNLKSNLRSARLELKQTSASFESRNEEMSKASGRSSPLSVEEPPLIAALRSQISHLKNELEDARMHESRTIATAEYDQADVMRLRSQLERAEHELGRLKNVKMEPNRIVEDLKEALAKADELVHLAAEKEASMKVELEDTKAIIVALEQSNRQCRNESITEVNGLAKRLLKLENDAEKSRLQADMELQQCREEADELRREVFRLSGELKEETHRANFEATERKKERKEFNMIIEQGEQEGKMFKEAIKSLERRLEKAEKQAEERAQQPATRSVKRKLGFDRSVKPNVLSIQPDFGKLEEELNTKKEAESKLKKEVLELEGRLHVAEATASHARSQMTVLTRQGNSKHTEMEQEVRNLRAELEAQSKKSRDAESDRAQHEEELKNVREHQETMKSEMSSLASKLVTTESKMKDEIFRAEEERRMAVETDAERVEEILRLKSRLHRTKVEASSRKPVERMVPTANVAHQATEKIKMPQVSASFADKEDLATMEEAMEQARSVLESKGIQSPSRKKAWYEDAPSFISSSESSDSYDSTDQSKKTSPTANQGTPATPTRSNNRSLFSKSSPMSFSTVSTKNEGSLFSVPSPERSPSPNLRSPPQLKKLSTPRGTVLPRVKEEVDERSSPQPSPVKKVDIDGIQRRLLASNDRLSAAKSKLRGLVQERNKEQQSKSKNDVDAILETISKQTQMAMEFRPSPRSSPTSLRASPISTGSQSPFQSIEGSFSTDAGASVGSPKTSPHSAARDAMSSTEQVLERYRRYKASRSRMMESPSRRTAMESPSRRTTIINQFVEFEQAEI